MAGYLATSIPVADGLVEKLADFVHTDAKLPPQNKQFEITQPITLSNRQSRQEIIEYLSGIRNENATADLAFYTYRDMTNCDWRPFVKAAIERNPVCIEKTRNMPVEKVLGWLSEIPDESTYDGPRLAQPDEVANTLRGDGLEKAILMANVLLGRNTASQIDIIADKSDVIVQTGDSNTSGCPTEMRFTSTKGLSKHIRLAENGTIEIIG